MLAEPRCGLASPLTCLSFFCSFILSYSSGLTVYLISDYLSNYLINYFLISSDVQFSLILFLLSLKTLFAATTKIKLVLLVSAVSSFISSLLLAYLCSNWFLQRTSRGQRSTLLDERCWVLKKKKWTRSDSDLIWFSLQFRLPWLNKQEVVLHHYKNKNKNSFLMKHLISVSL